MKKLYGIGVLCAFALCASVRVASAQAPSQASPPTDSAITPLSVMGVVTSYTPETQLVVVTTNAGSTVNVQLNDRTEFMRIPPGEKTKDKFIKIASTDFAVGDMVFARGRMSEDRKNLPAREFYVMSKGDIAQKRDREREEWRTRGISGTINALNAEAKEITLDARTHEGTKAIVLAPTANTKFRRYAPNSIRFSDATESTFAELKVGDQLRGLGTKNAEGTRFTPEEVVSGAFQTIGGAVTEINAETKEVKIKDVQSNQVVTVIVSKDSSMRRLTPELLAALAPAKPGTTQTPAAVAPPAKSGGDLQEMFDQLPALTLQELKVGDSILVSSTKGSDPSRVTAIAVVSGVETLLQGGQASRGSVALGAMSLGGP